MDLIACDISQGLLHALPQLHAPQANPTTSPATYEKYLRARFYSYKFNQASFEKAVGLFNEVIAEDPSFASACAELAARRVSDCGL